MPLTWGISLGKFKATTLLTNKEVRMGVQEVVDDTGEFLKFMAERNSPVKTGRLRRSWAMSTMGKGTKRKITVFNTAKTPKGIYYGPFVEYGTVRMAPRRFLYRAVMSAENRKRKWLEELEKKLSKRFNNG